VKEIIVARGHPNIRATHRTTLEITKDSHLTPRGDCIIGVCASKSISEIDERIKEWLRSGGKVEIEIILPQYGLKDRLFAFGSKNLRFKHPTDIVVRKSDYICDRTLAIKATKAAKDLNRDMVELLRDSNTELLFVLKKA